MDSDPRAAEYVLGTLRGEERRRFERELGRDPGLRRLVSEWEGRLSGLVDEIEPLAPSPDLWRRIEAEIGRAPETAARAETLRPGAGRAAARPGPLARLWDSLALWRALTAGAAVAACVLGAVALRPQPPALVAVLQSSGGPAFAVRVPDAERPAVTPVGGQSPPEGRAYELWVVPSGAAPRSLGLVAPDGVTRLPPGRIDPDLLRRGATLAVSLEPAGGSPTGQPTGPVLFTGTLVELR